MPFLPSTPFTHLEIFRLSYCVATALILAARLISNHRYLSAREATEVPPLFLAAVPVVRLPPAIATGCGLAVIIALIAGGFGRSAPLSLAIASAGSLLYFAQIISRPSVRRKANTIPIVLLLLASSSLTTPEMRLPIDAVVLTTIQVLIAQIYLAAGLSKLRTAGWRWLDGKTLRAWLVYYHLRKPSLQTEFMTSSLSRCRAAAWATLAFELSFWLVIPFPDLGWILIPAAILFHFATAIFMRIHYWLHLGPAYLVFAAPMLANLFAEGT